jgi:hypothetical protein
VSSLHIQYPPRYLLYCTYECIFVAVLENASRPCESSQKKGIVMIQSSTACSRLTILLIPDNIDIVEGKVTSHHHRCYQKLVLVGVNLIFLPSSFGTFYENALLPFLLGSFAVGSVLR